MSADDKNTQARKIAHALVDCRDTAVTHGDIDRWPPHEVEVWLRAWDYEWSGYFWEWMGEFEPSDGVLGEGATQ